MSTYLPPKFHMVHLKISYLEKESPFEKNTLFSGEPCEISGVYLPRCCTTSPLVGNPFRAATLRTRVTDAGYTDLCAMALWYHRCRVGLREGAGKTPGCRGNRQAAQQKN